MINKEDFMQACSELWDTKIEKNDVVSGSLVVLFSGNEGGSITTLMKGRLSDRGIGSAFFQVVEKWIES